MKYNDLVFKKSNFELYHFIIYREDLKIYVIEPLYAHNSLFTLISYEEVKEEDFSDNFLTSYENVLQFLEETRVEEIDKASKVLKRRLRKLSRLEFQLDCMKRHEASIEHIKSWNRAIRRENKKIERSRAKQDSELNRIETKYKKEFGYLARKKEEFKGNTFFKEREK